MRFECRTGFTLVELLVAVLLFDVGVLAMVASSTMLVRQQVELRARVAASQVAANRIQRLIAGSCIAASGEASTDRGVTEQWSESLLANAVRELRDSVAFIVNGAEHHVVIRSRAAC